MNTTRLSRRQCIAAGMIPLLAHPAALLAQVRGDAARILCGYPAGGSIDVVARMAAAKLARNGGASTIVENRAGAAGRLAVMDLKKSPADGRALLLTPASVLTMYPHVYPDLGYDPFADVAAVCTVAATGFALAVGPRVPASIRDVDAFAKWCREERSRAQVGNAGAGSMPHFMAILLAREARLAVDHVPYRGGGAAMQAVAAGELSSALATEAAARPLAQAGRLRVLATSGSERSPFFPQSPTFGELGMPSLTQREWYGVFAPAATPSRVTEAISHTLRDGMSEADARDLLQKTGLVPDALDGVQLAAATRREHAFWGPLIRGSGFKPES